MIIPNRNLVTETSKQTYLIIMAKRFEIIGC